MHSTLNYPGWRSAYRLAQHTRMLHEALQPLGVRLINLLSPTSAVSDSSKDGRHFPLEVNVDVLSVLLNAWADEAGFDGRALLPGCPPGL